MQILFTLISWYCNREHHSASGSVLDLLLPLLKHLCRLEVNLSNHKEATLPKIEGLKRLSEKYWKWSSLKWMLLRVKHTLNEFLHPFIVRPLPVNLTTLDTAMKFIYYLLDLGW